MLDVTRARHFAQKPPSVTDGLLMGAPQRERGMWSFLTWSFFLSQIAVGNAFAGGSAQAAAAFGDHSQSSGDAHTANTTSVPGQPDVRASGGEDAETANAPRAAAQSQSASSTAGPDPVAVERVHLTDDSSSAGRSFSTQGGGLLDGGATEPDVPAGEHPDVELPPLAELPPVVGLPPVLDGIMPPVLDTLPPILDTIDDLVEGLGPILGDILVPIVETIEDLGDVLGPVIDHVLVPIENVVENAIDDVGELTAPIGGAADQILELADPILDHVDAVLPPLPDLVEAIEPIVDIAEPILDVIDIVQPADKPILGILPLNIGGGMAMAEADDAIDVVAAPGHLDFGMNAEPVVHEFFQAGAYTEYGLAMQQAPAGAEGAVGELLVDVVAPFDAILGDGDDAGHGPQALFGHLQHEMGLRGLGDGLT